MKAQIKIIFISVILIQEYRSIKTLPNYIFPQSKSIQTLDAKQNFTSCLKKDFSKLCEKIPEDLKEAETLDERFELLGRGGFGKVYKYKNKALKQIMIYSEEIAKMIQQEYCASRAIFSFQNKNLQSVESCYYEPDQDGDLPFDYFYQLQELLALNLGYSHTNEKPTYLFLEKFTVKQRIHFYAELFKALLTLHQADLIHMDIKPDNIMSNQNFIEGEIDLPNFHLVLIDYGLMNLKDQKALTCTPYSHPECHEKKINYLMPQLDNFQLALTLLTIESYKEFKKSDPDDEEDINREDDKFIVVEIGKKNLRENLQATKNLIKIEFDSIAQITESQEIEKCDDLYCVLYCCLKDDINKIPSADKIVQNLERLESSKILIQLINYKFQFQTKLSN